MVATAPVDVSEHYATKAELGEIKAILPHLATKADLAGLQVSIKEDMATFQTATREDMATKHDLAILQSNIQTSIETSVSAARSEMERGLRQTVFILVGVMMAGYVTLIGALIVAILATAG